MNNEENLFISEEISKDVDFEQFKNVDKSSNNDFINIEFRSEKSNSINGKLLSYKIKSIGKNLYEYHFIFVIKDSDVVEYISNSAIYTSVIVSVSGENVLDFDIGTKQIIESSMKNDGKYDGIVFKNVYV